MNNLSQSPCRARWTMLPWLLAALLLGGCAAGGTHSDYGPDSWEKLIAADCLAFYDGCNNCRRGAAGQPAACTRKACQSYGKPVCLDDAGEAYDANSWKTMIPASCMAYFDGCNNCRRGAEGQPGACTRKACQAYRKPVCLDAAGEASNAAGRMKLVTYACDGDARFVVHYGEYRADDQRVGLGEGQIMLFDRQTRTAYRLQRVPAASGEKYSDGKLEFWGRGDEAMLLQNGEQLYRNCRIEG